VKSKKLILFGAGINGRRALIHYGDERVHCFADNNIVGQTLCGKLIISFNELLQIHNDYEVIISLSYDNAPEVMTQCRENGIQAKIFQDIATYEDLDSLPEIAKFKDVHKGKRCFIIGNGPSLRADDLNKLYEYNEITFGCNRIYKIFSFTKWRPKYYFVSDAAILKTYCENIAKVEARVKFFPRLEMGLLMKSTYPISVNEIINIRKIISENEYEVCFYNIVYSKRFEECPSYSEDPSKALYSGGGTVVNYQLQMASYMGFSEIFLLGVDNASTIRTEAETYLSQQRHFYEETQNDIGQFEVHWIKHSRNEQEDINVRNKNFAFAEAYSRKHGFRIYNATCGGMLETFERVDFDSIFS